LYKARAARSWPQNEGGADAACRSAAEVYSWRELFREAQAMGRLALAAAVVLAAATPALAQQTVYNGGSTDYRPNSSLSSNGHVQSAEQGLDAQFRKIDLNHDGMISRFEWNVAGMLVTDFANLDANRDGKVSADEWGGALAATSDAKADKAKVSKK
jgi:hypothetical protein